MIHLERGRAPRLSLCHLLSRKSDSHSNKTSLGFVQAALYLLSLLEKPNHPMYFLCIPLLINAKISCVTKKTPVVVSTNMRNLIISSTAGRSANCNQRDREKKETKCEQDLTVALATSNSPIKQWQSMTMK